MPGRGEPDSDGEINFKHVLATLDDQGYQVIYIILDSHEYQVCMLYILKKALLKLSKKEKKIYT